MKEDNEKSVVELDDEIIVLEDALEKNPAPETYLRMKELMILSNSKSFNKWKIQ